MFQNLLYARFCRYRCEKKEIEVEKKTSIECARAGGGAGESGFLSILENAHKVGHLSAQQAEYILKDKSSELSQSISTSRQQEYIEEIQNMSAARHIVSNKPAFEQRQFFKNNILPSVLPKPERPSVTLDMDGIEIDLRTYKRTTAAASRSLNNRLGMTASSIAKIGSMDSSSCSMPINLASSDLSVEMTGVSTKEKRTTTDLDNERIKRMSKRAMKKCRGSKRPKDMDDDEIEDRRAARKAIDIYRGILDNGTSTIELEIVKNSVSDDDASFNSEKYNQTYMNMNVYE